MDKLFKKFVCDVVYIMADVIADAARDRRRESLKPTGYIDAYNARNPSGTFLVDNLIKKPVCDLKKVCIEMLKVSTCKEGVLA